MWLTPVKFLQRAKVNIDRTDRTASMADDRGSPTLTGVHRTAIGAAVAREDRLAVARTRLNQYVILGAGLDSYALRHAADLNELNVFEVDDAPVQAWKQ